jgi:hypothetical protein
VRCRRIGVIDRMIGRDDEVQRFAEQRLTIRSSPVISGSRA